MGGAPRALEWAAAGDVRPGVRVGLQHHYLAAPRVDVLPAGAHAVVAVVAVAMLWWAGRLCESGQQRDRFSCTQVTDVLGLGAFVRVVMASGDPDPQTLAVCGWRAGRPRGRRCPPTGGVFH